MKLKEKQNKMAEEIRNGLKARRISQPEFCKAFLKDYYGDLIEEQEVENHNERFKKVLKLERKCEMIALYYHYYRTKYLHEKSMPDEARNAAHHFYVEIGSRVVSQPLSDGLDEEVLNSLYQFFQEWRRISKENGVDSQAFYEYSKEYMNEVLRPFLSKWRKKECEGIESKVFREELKELQAYTSKYIEELKEDFRF